MGCRQLFVRLAGCNLACTYCDTPEGLARPQQYRVEVAAGERDFVLSLNPAPAQEVWLQLRRLLAFRHQALTFTGGEPLVQASFISEVLVGLGEDRPPVYLETNGILADELEAILPYVDIISMDFKLPSACGQELGEKHALFLRSAAARKVQVKMVVTREATLSELEQGARIIAGVDPRIPLVIQPVTPTGGAGAAEPCIVRRWQARAMEYLEDVRVIPQVHRQLKEL